MSDYPRDLKGYGRAIPDPRWPGGAYVAVQFVLNYEEGGENNILHGDAASEAFLSEIVGAQPWPGQRHWNMESIYEYGARAGFWRLWRLFTGRKVPLTIYGVATALMRSPEQVAAMKEADWEIASHGLKWIEHKDMPEDDERKSIRESIRIHAEVTGDRPLGWYTGRCSINTTRLVMEEGGFYTLPTIIRTTCLTGWRGRKAANTSSFPIRSTATTCALQPRRASIPATSSSPISRTRSIVSMKKAGAVRRR
jgi:peptidoglycan/xylan/chitin deacetylase (PgdA/CDA1 family)